MSVLKFASQSARRGRQVYRDTTAAISLSSMEALLMGKVFVLPKFFLPQRQSSLKLRIFSIALKFSTLSILRHVHPKLLQAAHLLPAKPLPRICHSEVFIETGFIKSCRYLDTAALVYSWYSSDCWEEESLSSSMIRRVNALHRSDLLKCTLQKEYLR